MLLELGAIVSIMNSTTPHLGQTVSLLDLNVACDDKKILIYLLFNLIQLHVHTLSIYRGIIGSIIII